MSSSANASEYLDLSTLKSLAENLPEGFEVETADFSNVNVTPIGRYVSQSRTITGKQKPDGTFGFTVTLDGGLHAQDQSGRVFNDKYPLKTFPSTKLFEFPGRPGKTSGISEYLKAVGFNPKGMTLGEILEAVEQSQTIPVVVVVGWTDRSIKDELTNTYTNRNLKTKDFNRGTKESPSYVPEVTIEGTTYTAKEQVNGWGKFVG